MIKSSECTTKYIKVSREEILLIIFSLAITVLLYIQTINAPFYFDDIPNIVENPYIKLYEINFDKLIEMVKFSPSNNRPLPMLTFALNYHFHQYTTFGYHLINIMIHLMNGILVYFISKFTLCFISESLKPQEKYIPFFVTFIWLIHPLHIQSVTYIVQRMNSMASMFYMLTILLYILGRLERRSHPKRIYFLLSILSGLMALGSKEIAAMLPVSLFLYEWLIIQKMDMQWLKRMIPGIIVIFFLFLFFGLVYTDFNPWSKILDGYDRREFTIYQRILTELRVIIFYISLLLLPTPSRLTLTHDFTVSTSFLDPVTTILSLGLILCLIAFAIYFANKKVIVTFCILWFFINLFIESSFIGLELIFEHRTYLPSVFFCFLLVYIIFKKLKKRSRNIVLLATLGLLSIFNYQRNSTWADEIDFWRDAVEKSPHLARTHNNLGNVLSKNGFILEAIEEYTIALKIDPDNPIIYNNLGDIYLEKEDLEKAYDFYSKAVDLNPEYVNALNHLGIILLRMGNHSDAIDLFLKSLSLNDKNINTYNYLGLALYRTNKIEQARNLFLEALEIDKYHIETNNNIGKLYFESEKYPEALLHYHRALKIDPQDGTTLKNIGDTYAKMGNFVEAVEYYNKTLKVDPMNDQIYNNLGIIFIDMGKTIEGIYYLNKALEINPNNRTAKNVLIKIKGLN